MEQALVEGLHPVLDLPLRDGRRDLGCPLGFPDAVPDLSGADHHLDGGDAALAADPRNQALRDDPLDDGRELVTDLLLLVGRKRADDPVDRLRRVQRVEGREDQVAGLRGVQRHGSSSRDRSRAG